MKLLVTGGCGFIGSALIRHIIQTTEVDIVNVDKLTYAATPEALEECAASKRYVLEQKDISDTSAISKIFAKHRPDGVIHLAAESHVDRSIDGPEAFISTNVVGSYVLLNEARKYWMSLSDPEKADFRFHHVSTDEVFGSLQAADPAFTEDTPYSPRSPYSASKAASDHLVQAWHETYGLPVIMTNCSNNYGLWQFPEKLVPVIIINAIEGKPLPIYGKGENVRDWLHVEDHASALWLAFTGGRVGRRYNIGGNAERRNIDVVRAICDLLDELEPRKAGGSYSEQMEYVTDRPGHDFRYAIDSRRIHAELGWEPKYSFEDGLRQTVAWYLSNRQWWQNIRANSYDGQRLGAAK